MKEKKSFAGANGKDNLPSLAQKLFGLGGLP
jgi:hypothetical protein